MIFIAPSIDLLIGSMAAKSTPMAYDAVGSLKSFADFGKYWLDFIFF